MMDAEFRRQIRDMSSQEFAETFLWIDDVEDLDGPGFKPLQLWDRQKDLYEEMDRSKEVYVPGTRQVGKSLAIGVKCIKTCLEEPRAECLVISKNETEAKYLITKRIVPMLRTLPGIGEIKNGLPWPKWNPFAQRLEFYDEAGNLDSWIESLTSNDSAGKGRSARLLVLDEACDIEFAREIYRTARPSVRRNPRGQIFIFSNSRPGSWFNNQVKKIRDGKVMGVSMVFMSPTADPSISKEFLDEEKTKYDTLAEFYQNYPPDLDSFLMRRQGKVFPTYSDIEGGDHVRDFVPDWSWDVCFLYDHGFRHDTVFLICLYDKYRDVVYALDELYLEGADLEDVSSEINRAKGAWKKKGMPNPVKKIADYSIFKQEGRQTIGDVLRFYTNINFTPCTKYDEVGTLAKMRNRISKNRLVIHPRCQNLRRQIRELYWKSTEPGAKEVPVDKDNDGVDLLRYLENEIKAVVASSDLNLPPAKFSAEARRRKEQNRALIFGEPAKAINDQAWQAY